MKGFELSSLARDDLKKIARFTEKRWGRHRRFLYIKQFDEVFHALAKHPTMGKKCDEIKKGYRKFPQGSHIVFYRQVEGGRIFIVRILHKSMDIESKLPYG